MQTAHIKSPQLPQNMRTQADAPKKNVVHLHTIDIFETQATDPKDRNLEQLKALNLDLTKIEKLAHAIGENANEAWTRIWTLKSELIKSWRMCEAGKAGLFTKLNSMRREVNTLQIELQSMNAQLRIK